MYKCSFLHSAFRCFTTLQAVSPTLKCEQTGNCTTPSSTTRHASPDRIQSQSLDLRIAKSPRQKQQEKLDSNEVAPNPIIIPIQVEPFIVPETTESYDSKTLEGTWPDEANMLLKKNIEHISLSPNTGFSSSREKKSINFDTKREIRDIRDKIQDCNKFQKSKVGRREPH